MRTDDIPRFTVTQGIIDRMREINRLVSLCRSIGNRSVDMKLRRSCLARSVSSSLAIEGNTLGPRSVRDIINGKDVEGPYDEIVEVQNAVKAYGTVKDVDLWSLDNFLRIQDEMMSCLVEKTGFRDHGVAVFDGDARIYTAPPHEMVPAMMERLFDWCGRSDYDPPILTSVAHYYIECIHPFPDGNGRMGRIWHYAVLHEYDRIFDLMPIESAIVRHQDEYYAVLERCQRTDAQDCTEFIEFCLDMNIESLAALSHLKDERMSDLLTAMSDRPMTSSEIMERMGLSSKQHFLKHRLRPAVELGFVSMTDPDHPRSSRQRYIKRIL